MPVLAQPLPNRSLGDLCADALEHTARLESKAERLEKLCKRVLSQLIVSGTGKSISEKEHAARASLKYTEVEDECIEAQTAANIARAQSDGLKLKFEEWRTSQATARAEMNLR